MSEKMVEPKRIELSTSALRRQRFTCNYLI